MDKPQKIADLLNSLLQILEVIVIIIVIIFAVTFVSNPSKLGRYCGEFKKAYDSASIIKTSEE